MRFDPIYFLGMLGGRWGGGLSIYFCSFKCDHQQSASAQAIKPCARRRLTQEKKSKSSFHNTSAPKKDLYRVQMQMQIHPLKSMSRSRSPR